LWCGCVVGVVVCGSVFFGWVVLGLVLLVLCGCVLLLVFVCVCVCVCVFVCVCVCVCDCIGYGFLLHCGCNSAQGEQAEWAFCESNYLSQPSLRMAAEARVRRCTHQHAVVMVLSPSLVLPHRTS